MPIDSKKLDALQSAIKAALNPPVPVAMTAEEFLKYAGEQLAKLAHEDGETAKKRAQSLDAAFTAMKTASEAKLEKGDVVVFEEPATPAPAPVAALIEPPVAPAVPAATEPEPPPDVVKGAGFVWPADLADPKAREAIRNAGK
jgi:hypothetical protein